MQSSKNKSKQNGLFSYFPLSLSTVSKCVKHPGLQKHCRKNTMKKTHPEILIILRHAHRNKDLGAEADNGLSAKGRKQSRALARYFKKRFKRARVTLLSSPRNRCQETLEPIAKLSRAKIRLVDCLNQSDDSEQLRRRVADFEKLVSRDSGQKLIVACSHGDWIPAFLRKATGASITLEKGGWAELAWADEKGARLQLTWLLQSL